MLFYEPDSRFQYLYDVDGDAYPRYFTGFVRYRGPKVDFDKPYAVCVGSAHTFGRYVAKPFPLLLWDYTGLQFLNLGYGGVGASDFANSKSQLDLINRASFAIVQILSGRSVSSSVFSTIFGRCGFYQGRFFYAEDFVDHLIRNEPQKIDQYITETRRAFVQDTKTLLRRITVPTLLFYFSSRQPEYTINKSSVQGVLGAFPQLVNNEALLAIGTDCIKLVSKSGLPFPISHTNRHCDYYPSPQMHEEAARLLESKIAPWLPK